MYTDIEFHWQSRGYINFQREGTLFHKREVEWSFCVHRSMIPSWRSLQTLRDFANELGTSPLQSRTSSALLATSEHAEPYNFTEPYGYPDVPQFRIVKMYTHASLTKWRFMFIYSLSQQQTETGNCYHSVWHGNRLPWYMKNHSLWIPSYPEQYTRNRKSRTWWTEKKDWLPTKDAVSRLFRLQWRQYRLLCLLWCLCLLLCSCDKCNCWILCSIIHWQQSWQKKLN